MATPRTVLGYTQLLAASSTSRAPAAESQQFRSASAGAPSRDSGSDPEVGPKLRVPYVVNNSERIYMSVYIYMRVSICMYVCMCI